jgi:hypothetical protein
MRSLCVIGLLTNRGEEYLHMAAEFGTFGPTLFWIPGSWNLRMVYTDDILFPDIRLKRDTFTTSLP